MTKSQKQQSLQKNQDQEKSLPSVYKTNKTIRKKGLVDLEIWKNTGLKMVPYFRVFKLVMRELISFQILCNCLIKRMNSSRPVHSKRRLKMIQPLWKFIKNAKRSELFQYKIIVAIHNFFMECFQQKDLRYKKIQVKRKNELQAEQKSIVLGKRGILNLGNTCFMNSALQCLYKTQQIQIKCRQSLKALEGSQGPLLRAYVEICNEMQKPNSAAFKPQKIRQIVAAKNYVFQEFKQADACQWISTFLYTLCLQTNRIKQISHYEIDDSLRRSEDIRQIDTLWNESKKKDHSREKSIIDDIIYGRYKVTYKCLKCKEPNQDKNKQQKGLYTLFEKYHIAYLPIPLKKSKLQLTLQDSFHQFCAKEQLAGQNKMNCDECMTEQDTEKQMTLYETNKILILCMKRFDNLKTKERKIKVQMKLDCRFMNRYGNRQDSISYVLYGMINHYGSLESGHYTATCFDSTNGWVCYNDSSCKDMAETEALESARSAYVLFYRRVQSDRLL